MFEKANESKTSIHYKQSKGFIDIYVVPNEIFATNVEFDGKVLSKHEYLSLCAELY